MATSTAGPVRKNGNGARRALVNVSIVAGVVTVLLGFYTVFGVPAMLSECAAVMDTKLDRHAQRPHAGSIGNPQFDLLLRRLDSIDARLLNLEARP